MFRDDLGIDKIRQLFRWYPKDVWLYVLASCWARIAQEEHLMGRAGLVGDETGSAIIASRLVRDIMRLGFLMERVYPPYPKWFGRAFEDLNCAPTLTGLLSDVVNASSWQKRDISLAEAYKMLGEIHNSLNLTRIVPTEPSSFYSRPFTVIFGERFADALKEKIQDKDLSKLAGRRLIGCIDLISDSTDLLEDAERRTALCMLFE